MVAYVSLYRVSGAITWVRAREAFWVKLTGEWEEYRQHLRLMGRCF